MTALHTAERWEPEHELNQDRCIVKDLQSSIAFYRERLGFQLDFDGPEGDVYYAGVSRDGIGIMLRQRGVPFVKELSFIDEGLWGFEITDADGYVLAFFQVRDK